MGAMQGVESFLKYANHQPQQRCEIFYTLKEAQVLIEEWRLEYNTFRPHSSLKYRPPAPEAWLH
jgi:transposase InsO family protein